MHRGPGVKTTQHQEGRELWLAGTCLFRCWAKGRGRWSGLLGGRWAECLRTSAGRRRDGGVLPWGLPLLEQALPSETPLRCLRPTFLSEDHLLRQLGPGVGDQPLLRDSPGQPAASAPPSPPGPGGSLPVALAGQEPALGLALHRWGGPCTSGLQSPSTGVARITAGRREGREPGVQ